MSSLSPFIISSKSWLLNSVPSGFFYPFIIRFNSMCTMLFSVGTISFSPLLRFVYISCIRPTPYSAMENDYLFIYCLPVASPKLVKSFILLTVIFIKNYESTLSNYTLQYLDTALITIPKYWGSISSYGKSKNLFVS